MLNNNNIAIPNTIFYDPVHLIDPATDFYPAGQGVQIAYV